MGGRASVRAVVPVETPGGRASVRAVVPVETAVRAIVPLGKRVLVCAASAAIRHDLWISFNFLWLFC